ncbi:MAG: MFS transporter [Legionellales bacterium]|nr:MFS transporter [Legionellales bacterium]
MAYQKNSFQAWIICITASLFFCFHFTEATVMDALSAQLMQTFQLTAASLANLSASYFYGNLICLIPAGIILDRFSTKKVVCLMFSLLILGSVFFCFSGGFYTAFISRFIEGVGGTFAFLCCLRLASTWFTSDKLPLALGIIITIAFIGGILSHEPIIMLTNSFGWRGALFILSFIGLIALLLNYLFLRDNPSDIPDEKQIRLTFTQLTIQLKKVLTNPYTWIGALYTTFLNLPVLVLGALWSTIYLHQVHSFSIDQASIIASLTFFGLIIGTPIAGYYAKNEQRIAVLLLLGSFLSTLLLYLLIFYPGNSFFFLSLIFFALGLFSSTQSVGYSIVLTNSKTDIISLASSIISIFVMAGGTIIKILFGIILDHAWPGHITQSAVRSFSAMNFKFALLFLSVFFIASILLAFYYRFKIMQKTVHPQNAIDIKNSDRKKFEPEEA